MGIALVRDLEFRKNESAAFIAPYNDYLLRKRNNTQPRNRSGFISPSQIGGCQQWAINQLRGILGENNSDPWIDPFFAVANMIHNLYQSEGVTAGIFHADSIEKWVEYPPLRIGGCIDAEFISGPLCDFKTVNNYYWDKVQRDNAPLPWHLKQAHSYMLCEDKREMILIYIPRESPQRMKEIRVTWDDKIYKEIEEWCQQVLAKNRSGQDMPELFDWHNCQGCRFFGTNSKKFKPLQGKVI